MTLAPRISRAVPRSIRQERPGDSKDHLRLVRSLPCCVPGCGSHGDAHHLLKATDGAPKGVGRKNEDRWTLPVCRAHHDAIHRRGEDEAWLAERGIQARDLASSLWGCRGKEDPSASMRRVVENAKARAELKC